MAMVKIVLFHKFGDANVLQLDELPLAAPSKGEVRFKVEAIGLNLAEVAFRREYIENADSFPIWVTKQQACLMLLGEGVTEFDERSL